MDQDAGCVISGPISARHGLCLLELLQTVAAAQSVQSTAYLMAQNATQDLGSISFYRYTRRKFRCFGRCVPDNPFRDGCLVEESLDEVLDLLLFTQLENLTSTHPPMFSTSAIHQDPGATVYRYGDAEPLTRRWLGFHFTLICSVVTSMNWRVPHNWCTTDVFIIFDDLNSYMQDAICNSSILSESTCCSRHDLL
jgi:hypothetical protein